MKSLELFRKLCIVKDHPDLDRITAKAYEDLEEKIWKENLEASPHGRPWFTSFHASSFPPQEKACGRKALYTMLDIPQKEPTPPFLRATADIGKAVEYQIVYRWAKAGLLLGVDEPLWDGEQMTQLKFEDPSTWLTGSCDAILDLRPEVDFVVPVDVKSKKDEVIREMQLGKKSYEEKHYYQLQGYLYLCRLFHNSMGWSDLGLRPTEGGFIYYASRDNPRTAKEFWIPINNELIDSGISTLRSWRDSFIAEELPERPKDWKWTEEPCKWCPFKAHACKPDYKAKQVSLRNSEAVKFAKELRSEYNFDEIKEEVINRWPT